MGAEGCLWVAVRVFPNIFVFVFGGFLFSATEFAIIPKLFRTHPSWRPAWALFWAKLAATDPGRTTHLDGQYPAATATGRIVLALP
jgi:hypothetical protein